MKTGHLTVHASDDCAGLYALADGDDDLEADTLCIETPRGSVEVTGCDGGIVIEVVDGE